MSFIVLKTSNATNSICCHDVARFFLVNVPLTLAIHFFFLCDQKEKDDKKKEVAAQNGLSLTAFADDGAANSLRSDAALIRHRQTPYPVFDRSARS